jgi:hypothetical protein
MSAKLYHTKEEKRLATRARANALRRANPEPHRAYNRAYWAAHPEKMRASSKRNHYRSSYGIEPEYKEELLRKQGNKCALCRSLSPRSKRGWQLDHCHTTKWIRGVLCNRCNVGLRYFGDGDPALLQAALAYSNPNRKML